jgi:hypothetical protein
MSEHALAAVSAVPSARIVTSCLIECVSKYVGNVCEMCVSLLLLACFCPCVLTSTHMWAA